MMDDDVIPQKEALSEFLKYKEFSECIMPDSIKMVKS